MEAKRKDCQRRPEKSSKAVELRERNKLVKEEESQRSRVSMTIVGKSHKRLGI